jgi:hypothetical protein
VRIQSVIRGVFGVLLLTLISVPTFVPALHELLHYHRHHHCSATSTDAHLHAGEFACDLCDYLTTFTFFYYSTIVTSLDLHLAVSANDLSDTPFVRQLPAINHLRGPPGVMFA